MCVCVCVCISECVCAYLFHTCIYRNQRSKMRSTKKNIKFSIQFHYTYLFRLINKFKANALHFNGKVLFYLTTIPCHTISLDYIVCVFVFLYKSVCVYVLYSDGYWRYILYAVPFLYIMSSLPNYVYIGDTPTHTHTHTANMCIYILSPKSTQFLIWLEF